MTHPATDLRIALNVAASTAMLDGATSNQIDLIVALARGSNNYNILSGGRLTKTDANQIINFLYENGAHPVREKTAGEIEDDARTAEKIAAAASARKIAKRQDKEAKVRREAAEAEAARKVGGRRIRHVKFGEGTVVDENDRVATVIFDSQKKTMRIAPQVLEAI